MWILSAIYDAMWCLVEDFFLFMVVDLIAKTPLRSSSSDEAKRQVWLYESLVLLLVSVVVYLVDHRPFLLVTLTLMTFIYTQLYGRVNFYDLWTQLSTRWQEFEQHEESMEHLRQEQKRVYTDMVPPITSSPLPPFTTPMPYVRSGFADMNISPISPIQNFEHDMLAPNRYVQMRPYVMRTVPNHAVPTTASSHQPYFSKLPQSYDLQNHKIMPLEQQKISSVTPRKPLASRPVPSKGPTTPKPPDIKSKVLNALGIGRYSTTPPGLKNESNLCFLNSILQCLAHTPGLANLLEEKKNIIEGPQADIALLTTFTELMKKLMVLPDGTSRSLPDVAAFCQAAAVLSKGLVTRPSKLEEQTQQDAAEFLMWLLTALHDILNAGQKSEKNGPRQQSDECYTSPALATLKFIYGDLNENKISDLKSACKREIALASGLNNNSYAEPIQRLSDLEWLTHKQHNHSVVDELFTGQLVEVYHCIECNRLSVNIEPFLVLPIPIEQSRLQNGVTYLEDCFTKFGNIENLYGSNGLQCSCVAPDEKVTVPSHIRRRFASDSAVQSQLSSTLNWKTPARNGSDDSGFPDANFKTSTPVMNSGQPLLTPGPSSRVQLTDAQRRSLLRQLPDNLIIQLLRFGYNNEEKSVLKLHTAVSVPLQGLDLTHIIYDVVTNREDITSGQLGYCYDLYAVCLHIGGESSSYGHYVTLAKTEDGQWYKFDDEYVTSINIEYELKTKQVQENVYLLFYRRQS